MTDIFAERLRIALKNKHYTQQKLSDISKVSINSIRDYVRGVRLPNALFLIDICKTLDVSADWLLGLKDD